MARLDPGLEALGRQWNRVGPGDADDLEAERLGARDEGAFQLLAL
jgi:hypothetical protein